MKLKMHNLSTSHSQHTQKICYS